ncbi:phage virion morphogenesis protein [Bergeriella denitrificans]|uniref:Phage-like protein n=1 Tax=Bergeriella denitrificans TaxID=494 RepID=A0A378ULC5_BERDE|nr:phage virion morphogenesis protein [Bergeriella denitrificans]STZ76067.1 phage-like protein [Bergeriella denitrificans]STZ77483.1 phage-like protein [Bergeriella denitrificans]
MIEISLDADKLEHGLSQLLKNATDTRPMMRGLAAEMASLTEDNFDSESWGGTKWKQSRRAAAEGGKTLQKDGQLAASISTQTGNGFARIGSNKPYAAIHHMGGTVKAKNKPYLMVPVGKGFRKVKQVDIPARPYLPINGDGQLQTGAEQRLLDIALNSLSKDV